MEVADTGKSSSPRSKRAARLFSPVMTGKSGRCVSFYYFNIGNGTSMHVYAAQKNKRTGRLDLSKRLFSGENGDSNEWRLGRVALPDTLPSYQVKP